MKIVYTYHLKEMLETRNFPEDYPEKIYFEAEERYFDNKTESLIAIKKLPYKNKNRRITIVYIIDDEDVKILTLYAEKDKDIKKRVINGRWVKL